MPPFIDLTNEVFGALTALRSFRNTAHGVVWLCRCECGKKKRIESWGLRSGNHTSCGCRCFSSAKIRTHGYSGTRTYVAYRNMLLRCYDIRRKDYRVYGARGITVCAKWRANFLNFLKDMGECPTGLTLERRNTNGSYTPSNCYWATWKAQAANRNITPEYRKQRSEQFKSLWRQRGFRKRTHQARSEGAKRRWAIWRNEVSCTKL